MFVFFSFKDASNEMNAPSHKVDKDIMQPAPSSKLNSFSNSSLKFTPRSVEPAAKLKVVLIHINHFSCTNVMLCALGIN